MFLRTLESLIHKVMSLAYFTLLYGEDVLLRSAQAVYDFLLVFFSNFVPKTHHF